MKVTRVFNNYNKHHLTTFKSKVKTVILGNADEKLKDEIDNFEENHSGAKFLGEGLFSRAYILNGSNIVIKESIDADYAKRVNDGFLQEAKNLSKLPDELTDSQQLVANVKTQKGNYYLLTTFVDGVRSDALVNPWRKRHFASLFNDFFELDKAGIYHGDLNGGNCLIQKNGKTSLLDYQWADTFSLDNVKENDRKFKFPPFMMPANSQMFEMANLPFYFVKQYNKSDKSTIKDTFVLYLKEKAKYCSKRANYLRNRANIGNQYEYEKLQAKYLANPSEDMIKLQSLKLQLLYTFRQTFSITDKNNPSDKYNIISCVPYYLYTASCGKKLMDLTQELKTNSKDTDFKKLMDYEYKFGQYWKIKMLQELSGFNISSDGEYGVFKWILRNAMLNPHCEGEYVDTADDLSEKFSMTAQKNFGTITDISFLITNSKKTYKEDDYIFGISSVKDSFYDIDKEIKNTSEIKIPVSKNYSGEIRMLEKLKNNFIDSFTDSFYALNQQRTFACVAASIKALYDATLLAGTAAKVYYGTNESYVETYAKELEKFANSVSKKISDISVKLYQRAVKAIQGDDKNLAKSIYYDNLNRLDSFEHPNYSFDENLKFRNDT